MHELGLASAVVRAIDLKMANHPGQRVKKVVMEIGKLSPILPDAMRFCFEQCTAETSLKNTVLEIIETKGQGTCKECSETIETDAPHAICACGKTDFKWISGSELKIRHLELE